MTKEYTTVTVNIKNEAGEVIKTEENTFTSLIADTGKKLKEIATGILCVRVDLGVNATEAQFEEVDDPNYVEVISAIESEVSGNV